MGTGVRWRTGADRTRPPEREAPSSPSPQSTTRHCRRCWLSWRRRGRTRWTPQVTPNLTRGLLGIPPQLRRTLTWDRGREITEHQTITTETRMPTYLCKPRSPWQRGTDENTNQLLRQYLPKGADLRTFSQADLDAITHELNHRPRKTHRYRTPAEVYADLLNSSDALAA
ncbi:IS30 family transposase [Streptomyces sp. NPDC059534]|uniref:IS30 family transposase n=1 Tax=Streptomyces sp. NPDC059534 TaxID=3346859 RepID=UPI003686F522